MQLRRIWEYNIEPFVEDQFFGDPDRIEHFRFKAVMKRHGPTPRSDADVTDGDGEPESADASLRPQVLPPMGNRLEEEAALGHATVVEQQMAESVAVATSRSGRQGELICQPPPATGASRHRGRSPPGSDRSRPTAP